MIKSHLSMRTVTPASFEQKGSSVTVPPSIDLKKSKLTQHIRKLVFPLKPQKSNSKLIIRKKLRKVPEFVNEFVEVPNKEEYRAKSSIENYRASNSHRQICAFSKKEKPKQYHSASYRHNPDLPKGNNESARVYKPQVFHINKRSKITLYAAFESAKKETMRKPRPRRQIDKIDDKSKSEVPRISHQENSDEEIEFTQNPAKSIGEKIVLMNEIMLNPYA